MSDPSEHPNWNDLSRHALGVLKPRAAGRVEQHLVGCELCGERLRGIQDDYAVVRRDLKQGGLSAHSTDRGPVSIWVIETGRMWLIRVIGANVNWSGATSDKSTAVRRAMVEFAAHIPNHQCSMCPGSLRQTVDDGNVLETLNVRH